MLDVRNLSHRFGKKEVLKQISLRLDAGQILAIMGSSGGGKTTLLKCIAGLLTPTEGDVLIQDVSVVREPEKARRSLGLVFQYAALFDFLNVEQNILFGVERHTKLNAREKKALLAELLEAVSLAPEDATKMPSELSGGMRKRVGLARALALKPALLIYDEPTSGLDPVTAYSVDQLIVGTRDRLGVTSLVVSHDVSSVFRVADQIAFLHQGELLFVGSPGEFRDSRAPEIVDLVEKARAEALFAQN